MTTFFQRLDPENLKTRFWFFAFAIVFGLGFATLSRSPIPWYDEVFMASISESWLASGKLALGINELRSEEILTYGPVYFYLQGNLFRLFEMNIYTVRLPGFLAGVGVVCITFSLLKQWGITSKSARVFCLILSMDHMFGRGMYSGRMDLIAILMILLALYALQSSHTTPLRKQTCLLCLAGALAGISCLTTPRVIFWLFGLPFFAWSANDKHPFKMAAFRISVILSCASLLGLTWIHSATGGLIQYIEYLTSQNQLWHHVGGKSVLRHRSEFPIYGGIVIGTFFVFKKWKCIERNKKIAFAGLFTVLVSFTLLVNEVGPYESMILPTYISFIAISSSVMKKQQSTVLVMALLLATSFMFFGKKAVVFSEWQQRNPDPAFLEIQSMLKPNTSVLSDSKYFYFVRQSGAKFHSWRQIAADSSVETKDVTDSTIATLLLGTDFAIIDYRKEKDLKAFVDKYGYKLKAVSRKPMRWSTPWQSIRPVKYESGYPFRIYRITSSSSNDIDESLPIQQSPPKRVD